MVHKGLGFLRCAFFNPREAKFCKLKSKKESSSGRREGELWVNSLQGDLQGEQQRTGRLRNRKGGDHTTSNMRSVRDSSSEATNSDEEAIAQGMMHLAIACTHVQRVSMKETPAVGNPCIFSTCFVASGFKGFSSDIVCGRGHGFANLIADSLTFMCGQC